MNNLLDAFCSREKIPLFFGVVFFAVLFTNGASFAQPASRSASVQKVIIVAGQSNAVNLHADISYLPKDTNDAKIPFYYYSGGPPKGGYTFNSNSNGKWETLKYQTQNPYLFLQKDFFGPEMGLARKLYKAGYAIAVFKMSCFGTNLAKDWGKGITSGNKLYSILMGQIDTAFIELNKKNLSPEITGFFWMQGESDAENESYANNYNANLKKFINDLRADLKTPDMPFIIGRIGSHSSYAYKDIVRKAQADVCSEMINVRWVDTDDFPLDTDKIHYLADGVYRLGGRMADSWLALYPNGVDETNMPAEFKLTPNYPNPFNSETGISFSLPYACAVTVEVYNILGQKLIEPVNRLYEAGAGKVALSSKNLPSGVYIYRFNARPLAQRYGFSASGKMIILK
jgi:hypothetical protein